MKNTIKMEKILDAVARTGVYIEREAHGFFEYDVDWVFPCVIFTLCIRGDARARYDMREMSQRKNDLGLVMPGHVMRPIACSDDYTYACMAISQQMFNDLQMQSSLYNSAKFDKTPMCHLTEEQAQRLLAIVDQMAFIASHTTDEMPHRYQILLAEMMVGYELLHFFRKEQDAKWGEDRYATLFERFSDLVVAHHTESHSAAYYAGLLGYDARYFARVVRMVTNGISPAQWIEQYVVTRAKDLLRTQPEQTIKETAFRLGFADTAAFCHYFKRTTGLTPQEYKERTK